MSIILDTPILWTKKVTKVKQGEPKTSIILLISVAISIAIVCPLRYQIQKHGWSNIPCVETK